MAEVRVKWDAAFATTVDAAGEPWACLIRIKAGDYTVMVELENDDGQWTARVVKVEGGRLDLC